MEKNGSGSGSYYQKPVLSSNVFFKSTHFDAFCPFVVCLWTVCGLRHRYHYYTIQAEQKQAIKSNIIIYRPHVRMLFFQKEAKTSKNKAFSLLFQ
jgi:hypothetical protein